MCSLAYIVPRQVNLMTAGRGIQHAKVSTDDARCLHGVQLWVALPDQARWTEPPFKYHVLHPASLGHASPRHLT